MHRAFESEILPRLAEAVAIEHRTELKNHQRKEQEAYESKLERKRLEYKQQQEHAEALSKRAKEKEVEFLSSKDDIDVMEFCSNVLDLKRNQINNSLDQRLDHALLSMEQFVDLVEDEMEEHKQSRLFQLRNMFSPFIQQDDHDNKNNNKAKLNKTNNNSNERKSKKIDTKSKGKELLALSIVNARTVEKAEDLLFEKTTTTTASNSPQRKSSSSNGTNNATNAKVAKASKTHTMAADKDKTHRQISSSSSDKTDSSSSEEDGEDKKQSSESNDPILLHLGEQITRLQTIRDHLDEKANETTTTTLPIIRLEYQKEFPEKLLRSCSKTVIESRAIAASTANNALHTLLQIQSFFVNDFKEHHHQLTMELEELQQIFGETLELYYHQQEKAATNNNNNDNNNDDNNKNNINATSALEILRCDLDQWCKKIQQKYIQNLKNYETEQIDSSNKQLDRTRTQNATELRSLTKSLETMAFSSSKDNDNDNNNNDPKREIFRHKLSALELREMKACDSFLAEEGRIRTFRDTTDPNNNNNDNDDNNDNNNNNNNDSSSSSSSSLAMVEEKPLPIVDVRLKHPKQKNNNNNNNSTNSSPSSIPVHIVLDQDFSKWTQKKTIQEEFILNFQKITNLPFPLEIKTVRKEEEEESIILIDAYIVLLDNTIIDEQQQQQQLRDHIMKDETRRNLAKNLHCRMVLIGNYGLDLDNNNNDNGGTTTTTILNPRFNKFYSRTKITKQELIDMAGMGSERVYWDNALNDGYNRGNHPYYCPVGWIRFGMNVGTKEEFDLKYSGWHIAYHGINQGALGHILISTLRQGVREVQVQVQGQEGQEGQEQKGQATICLTPSIVYASNDTYASPWTLSDGTQVQVVLQCRVNPAAIMARRPNIIMGANDNAQIDGFFPNRELSWLVKPNDAAEEKKKKEKNEKDVGLPAEEEEGGPDHLVCYGILVRKIYC